MGQRCPECIREEGTQKVIPTRTRSGAFARRGIPATRTFIGLAVGFYLIAALGGIGGSVFEYLKQANDLVAAGEWWRIFTPVLLHASPMHILFNMWALWVLGPQVERGMGSGPFVALYLASAGAGGVLFFYLGETHAVAVGASGAIFGLFGIWANWAVHRRNTIQGRALLQRIGFLLLVNAAIPLFFPIIAWEAHLGGLVAGFAIGEAWSRLGGSAAPLARVGVAVVVVAVSVIAVLI